jgi:colanic acid biosynthesis protein WcaH
LKLDDKEFFQVVTNAPLVSIDLIVKDERGRVLLGLRRNKPAQGFWFVPGGRVFKDERIEQALKRIGLEELGFPLDTSRVKFLGVFEHLYEDNVFGKPGISTHYVVLGCEVMQPMALDQLPSGQHEGWRFWELPDLMKSDEVHRNTKAYFEKQPRTLVFKKKKSLKFTL